MTPNELTAVVAVGAAVVGAFVTVFALSLARAAKHGDQRMRAAARGRTSLPPAQPPPTWTSSVRPTRRNGEPTPTPIAKETDHDRTGQHHREGPKAPRPGTPGAALVLVNRQSQVDAAFTAAYPRVTMRPVSVSGTGRGAGATAGSRADLGQGRIGGRRALAH